MASPDDDEKPIGHSKITADRGRCAGLDPGRGRCAGLDPGLSCRTSPWKITLWMCVHSFGCESVSCEL